MASIGSFSLNRHWKWDENDNGPAASPVALTLVPDAVGVRVGRKVGAAELGVEEGVSVAASVGSIGVKVGRGVPACSGMAVMVKAAASVSGGARVRDGSRGKGVKVDVGSSVGL